MTDYFDIIIDRLIAECHPGLWSAPAWAADPAPRRSPGLGQAQLTPVAAMAEDGWVHHATEGVRTLWMYGDVGLATALRARGVCVVFGVPTTHACYWRVIPLAELADTLMVMAFCAAWSALIGEHVRAQEWSYPRLLIEGNIGYAAGRSALPLGHPGSAIEGVVGERCYTHGASPRG